MKFAGSRYSSKPDVEQPSRYPSLVPAVEQNFQFGKIQDQGQALALESG